MADVAAAEAKLLNLVNKAVTINGQPAFEKLNVNFGTPKREPGELVMGIEDDLKNTDMVRLSFEMKPELAKMNTQPHQVSDGVKKALAQVAALKPYVRFEDDATHALDLKAELQKFMDKGADLPKNLLEWVGFSDATERPDDYGAHMSKVDGVITVRLRVQDTAKTGKAGETLRDQIKADLEDKKTMLAGRIAKYKGLAKDDAAGLAAIKARVDDLVFDVTTEQYSVQSDSPNAYVQIQIMSKAQKALREDPATKENKAKLEEAGKSNILNELTSEQLGKAVGRSVLFAGKHAQDMFPLVAGRLDMKAAIGKSLTRLAAAKPELAAEVARFLNDDSFKSHNNWNKKASEKPVLKSQPFDNIDVSKPTQVVLDFAVPKNKAEEIFSAIAAAENIVAEAAPQAPAPAAIANPTVALGAAANPKDLPVVQNAKEAAAEPGFNGPGVDAQTRIAAQAIANLIREKQSQGMIR